MDDEKGLDLSLGLPCGGNSSSQKRKYVSSSDTRPDEGDRGSKLINEFKNFLEGGNQQHPLNVGENFYNNFPKPSADLETSKNSNTEGIWLTKDNRSTETKEEKRPVVGETTADDLTDRTKTSHISITTDEGSTADNEDVAESEVNGSTSRHVEDASNRFIARARKGSHEPAESSGVEILGHKRFTISSEKEFNVVNVPYSVQFPGKLLSMSSSHPQAIKDPSVIRGMATTNAENAVMQANFPLLFGYSHVQIPSLDKDNSRGVVSHHQLMHPTYPGKNSDTQNDSRKQNQVISHAPSESAQYDERAAEHRKSYGKQQGGEEGSSSHPDEDLKGNSDQPKAAESSHEFPAIRPGIAAEVKFGGCGSYPNLPWVSTTGQGPNGKTISGVTYKYSPTQIRIVCACHGSHMSPDEFVRHASAEENSSPNAAPFQSSNPAASAQS